MMNREHEAEGAAVYRISRRKFLVVFGSGAAVAAAGAYALTGPGVHPAGPLPAKTAFGEIQVIRAARGARLAADGTTAVGTAPGPEAFIRLAQTTASGSGTSVLTSVGAGTHASDHAGGHDGHVPATGHRQPENHTWGDVVVLEVEVSNTAESPMLFSPGQLRLQCLNGGSTAPKDSSRGVGPIAARSTELMWVSYLAPSEENTFTVEFSDPVHDQQLGLALPAWVSEQS